MLKVRIIPTLLWRDVGLVKGIGFDSWRRVGTIIPGIKVYNRRQVDEMIIVDVTATESNKAPDYLEINDFTSECFVPMTVGGGVKKINDIRELLRSGADKVCINTATYENPGLVSMAAGKFGSQCVVVSIDAKRVGDGDYECYSHSGQRGTGKGPGEWAQAMEEAGAGEILITSIDNDGTMEGYDIELTKRVSDSVGIPVIASGGAGNYQHMYEAITVGGASAVAAASIFHFTEQTPLEAKNYLSSRGIPVRDTNIR